MTTPQATSTVHRICPSCDAEHHADADAEPICPICGSRLVELSAADDLIGAVIDGRYEIRDRLGEGGMGTVYRAWQRSIGREVAIKLIDRRYSRDAMSVRRFLREARLSSQLSQPNTVSVFDFGQAADGRLFISMELIRGRTVDDLLRETGRFPVPRAAWIAVQMCDALEAAHNLQIVHRDLKGANVIILDEPPGRDLVKVVDFGLAKSLTADESGSTQTGLVVGTPQYMAPETAAGGRATPAADLYALGVLLAEMTTGKQLWQSTSFAALIGQKLNGSPVTREVPTELRGLVERLIAAEPEQRPGSAAEVRAVLVGLVDDRAIAPRPTPVASRPAVGEAPTVVSRKTPSARAETVAPPARRGWLAPAAALAVAVAAAAVYLATRDDAPPSAATTAPAPVEPAAAAAPPDAAPAPPPVPEPPPPPIGLGIVSRPAGAEVWLDGRLAGVTPLELALPRGDTAIEVRLEAKGRDPVTRTVVPDRDHRLDVDLPRTKRRPRGGTRPDPDRQTPF